MQTQPPPHFELTIRYTTAEDGSHVFSVVERDDYLRYCRHLRCAPFRVVLDPDIAADIGGVSGNDLLLNSVEHALFPHMAIVTPTWANRP